MTGARKTVPGPGTGAQRCPGTTPAPRPRPVPGPVPSRCGAPGPGTASGASESGHRPMAWKGAWPPALCLGCGAILNPCRTTGFHVNCRPDRWTADRLWRMGYDVSIFLVSTPVRREACRSCGAQVLAALDGGLVAVTEPGAILGGAPAEFVWRYSGRATYDLVTYANRKELIYRDQVRIRTRRFPVHGQHECNYLGKTCIGYDPTDYRAPKGPALSTRTRVPVTAAPPF